MLRFPILRIDNMSDGSSEENGQARPSYGSFQDSSSMEALFDEDVAYTPYSDISAQQEFSLQYRIKMFIIYGIYLPGTALIAGLCEVSHGRAKLAAIWLSTSYVCSVFACLFEVVSRSEGPLDFIRKRLEFFLWPMISFSVGFVVRLQAIGFDADVGSIVAKFSIYIMIANCLALCVAQHEEGERQLRWPYIPRDRRAY